MRALGLAVALALLAAAPAAAAPHLQSLGSFDTPVGIAAPPLDSSRVMVVEKGGTVRMLRDGVRIDTPFLDVSAITESGATERGLLSIAFPPDYQQSGLFYAFLTAKPLGDVQIREFRRADADHAAPGTGRLVVSYPHEAPNHNGGQLQFTPDGLLWFTIGDNANEANAQNTAVPYGKLHRIDPRASGGNAYTVPAGNPFVGNTLWAYGLRNPWRFSFDRATGDLLIGDVGANSWEEIDFAPHTSDPATSLRPRANYGWPCREGRHDGPDPGTCTGPLVEPVIDHPHSDNWHAIIGGYVVRDPGLPTLAGRYLYGDFSQPAMHILTPASGADAEAGLTSSNLTALGEDACGRLYAASYGGDVSRIVDGAPSPCSFPPPPGPGGGSPPPAADTTACALEVAARGTGLVTVRRYLRLRVRSNEACRLTITGRVPGIARFRTLRRTVKPGTTTLKLRLGRNANRRLHHAVRGKRSVRVRLRVRGVDAAGNERVLSRRVRVRR